MRVLEETINQRMRAGMSIAFFLGKQGKIDLFVDPTSYEFTMIDEAVTAFLERSKEEVISVERFCRELETDVWPLISIQDYVESSGYDVDLINFGGITAFCKNKSKKYSRQTHLRERKQKNGGNVWLFEREVIEEAFQRIR